MVSVMMFYSMGELDKISDKNDLPRDKQCADCEAALVQGFRL